MLCVACIAALQRLRLYTAWPADSMVAAKPEMVMEIERIKYLGLDIVGYNRADWRVYDGVNVWCAQSYIAAARVAASIKNEQKAN